MAFSSDSRRVVVGLSKGGISVWDIGSHKEVMTSLVHKGPVCSVRYSLDGNYIVSASEDKTICILDSANLKPLRPPLTGHTSVILCMANAPDGTHVVTGSLDSTIRIWDVRVEG